MFIFIYFMGIKRSYKEKKVGNLMYMLVIECIYNIFFENIFMI